jgi:hypothetical protein
MGKQSEVCTHGDTEGGGGYVGKCTMGEQSEVCGVGAQLAGAPRCGVRCAGCAMRGERGVFHVSEFRV